MRSKTHYLGLDVLRLVAASLVVLDHFGSYGWHTVSATGAQGDLAFPFLTGMTNVGSVGVEIFFLLSGFVIAASAQGTAPVQFALSRGIRVFPALWLCGLIALAARAGAGEPLGQLVNFFARSAVLSPAGPYIDGVVWTLVVEAVFYLLVFTVLVRDGFDRIALVAKVLGVASAAFVVVMAAAVIFSPVHPAAATLAALCDRFPFKVLLLRHGVFFALGILLWSGFETGFTRVTLRWMTGLAAICTIELGINRGSAAEAFVTILLWWIGLAALVASVVWGETLSRLLGFWRKPIQDLGRLSYPLYLNHYTLGMVLVPTLASHGLGRGAAFAAALAIVVGSAYAIMRYPERWAQRLLRAKLRDRLKTGTAPGESRILPAGLA